MNNVSWDPVWESVFSSREWGRYPGEHLIRFIARNFYSISDRRMIRVLEVGCGPGANIWFLAREGFSFAGIDGSQTAISQAKQRLDDEIPSWQENGELHVGDIIQLPYANSQFDAIIDVEATYANSWEAARSIFREIARVTKPGGKIYSQTFATGCWGEGTGESAGRNAWRCSEGPLADKGISRFTSLEEIPALLGDLTVLSIESITWSLNNRQNSIREWAITAVRS